MLDTKFQPNAKRIIGTIAHPLFRANYGSLIEYLDLSLQHRSGADVIFQLQKRLVDEVLKLQKESKDNRADDDERLSDVYRTLLGCLKVIADGIAWRSLDYERGTLQELAWHNQTGFIEPTSVAAELSEAEDYVEKLGAIVLLNDLTNCLRYGDLTVVTEEKVFILEVKAGKGSRGSGRASRQRQGLQALLEFINRRERFVDGNREALIRVQTKPKGYVEELESLISDARRTGASYARVSDALAVNVLFPDVLVNSEPKFDDVVTNPFEQSRFVKCSNYELFGIFSPNLPPYSVFPLSAPNRVALMTGEIWVVTYVNIGNVVRALRRQHLMVRLPTSEEVDALPSRLAPGQVRNLGLVAPIAVTDGRQGMELSIGEFHKLGMELLDEDCWAASLREVISTPTSKEHKAYHEFADERERWD